ncbi:hypothetical protein FA15DRAFT_662001 [Coprinopsis marcescibilis]|uniref:Uncharacterized protein n=1 Tax=Coprinopsis marcescibilis TaxID=230819 RepID=A0A5C3KAK4_COPMA|nr:hypothetical protein FA15DRAFT_662001 [Coprinopsis marcescibilis]
MPLLRVQANLNGTAAQGLTEFNGLLELEHTSSTISESPETIHKFPPERSVFEGLGTRIHHHRSAPFSASTPLAPPDTAGRIEERLGQLVDKYISPRAYSAYIGPIDKSNTRASARDVRLNRLIRSAWPGCFSDSESLASNPELTYQSSQIETRRTALNWKGESGPRKKKVQHSTFCINIQTSTGAKSTSNFSSGLEPPSHSDTNISDI